jgi:hypothetical protein
MTTATNTAAIGKAADLKCEVGEAPRHFPFECPAAASSIFGTRSSRSVQAKSSHIAPANAMRLAILKAHQPGREPHEFVHHHMLSRLSRPNIIHLP